MWKKYRWSPRERALVEVNLDEPPAERHSPDIMPDIPDFRSPVDGTVVHGRAGLRQHNLRNGVTNAADFKQTWAKAAAERAAFYEGKARDSERKRDVVQAYEKNRRR